jgi:hypothetical protein
VRPRVGPALVKGRLQPVGWMAGVITSEENEMPSYSKEIRMNQESPAVYSISNTLV